MNPLLAEFCTITQKNTANWLKFFANACFTLFPFRKAWIHFSLNSVPSPRILTTCNRNEKVNFYIGLKFYQKFIILHSLSSERHESTYPRTLYHHLVSWLNVSIKIRFVNIYSSWGSSCCNFFVMTLNKAWIHFSLYSVPSLSILKISNGMKSNW